MPITGNVLWWPSGRPSYVGLFSAVGPAFICDIRSELRPYPDELTNESLYLDIEPPPAESTNPTTSEYSSKLKSIARSAKIGKSPVCHQMESDGQIPTRSGPVTRQQLMPITVSVRRRKATATTEPTSILNPHLKFSTPPTASVLRCSDKGYGSRESEGYANIEAESGSANIFLFNDEEREAIRRAEKSRCDKNRFAEKGADANLPPFPYFSSGREVCWVGSERGLCRSSARRLIARSNDTLSTLPHLASSRS